MDSEKIVEQGTNEIARPLIETCDAILRSRPNSAIVVIGTGTRGAYSVMRKLARRLPGRGDHRRVKLLDISIKLLFGPKNTGSLGKLSIPCLADASLQTGTQKETNFFLVI